MVEYIVFCSLPELNCEVTNVVKPSNKDRAAEKIIILLNEFSIRKKFQLVENVTRRRDKYPKTIPD